jgi:ABC-type transport system involved in multi-copper enzyme maturation permease subunit
MPAGGIGVWLGQIGAIIRLEMKKTFLSKRGLWVYLLALAPVGITTIHSLVELNSMAERRALAAARPANPNALASIGPQTKEEDLLALLGEPHLERRFGPRGRSVQYTDGRDLYTYFVFEGEVRSINKRTRDTVQQDTVIFASIFQFFYLRLAIFFGCVGVFTNLFRGELLDRSLHYYLLSPVRREVLVVGKYFAGLIATTTIFTLSTALQMWTMSWHFDANEKAAFLQNDGWWQAAAYLGVTVAACVGYGSLFLVAGLLFKNPIIPAVAVELWESANIFLPAVLKKISVIYYLQSMCPIVASPEEDLNRVLKMLVTAAEPVSTPVAVIGLVVVTCVLLAVGGRLARRLEINYSTD